MRCVGLLKRLANWHCRNCKPDPGSAALVLQRKKLLVDMLYMMFQNFDGDDHIHIEVATQTINWSQEKDLDFTELEIREIMEDVTALHVEGDGQWILDGDTLMLQYPSDSE